MNIDKTTLALPETCYFKEKRAKSLVLLHYTAGFSAKSSVDFWRQQANKVSTPYIIDTDGVVYQTYDPACWSYHLGFKGTWAHDKRSIAIETANIGPLKLVGDTLYCWPNNYKQAYCKLSDTDKYVKASYRGFDYHAAFTPAQLAVMPQLVGQICDEFNIPKVIPPKESRGKFDLRLFANFNGIIDHAAARSDKTDCGPAFPWEILENI